MPKALALLFIAAINALRPPGYVRAKAAAAGFSDFIRANNKASARFMLSPARKVELELLQPAQEKSACCSVIFSDMFKRASEITTAVINLVIDARSEEHTSELQSRENLVCRLLLEKKKT